MFSKRRPPGKTEDNFDQADDYVEMTEDEAAPEMESPAWEDAAEAAAYGDEDDLEGLGQSTPVRKSSPISSLLPMAAAAVVGVVGIGLVYVNFIAPSSTPVDTSPVPAVVAPENTTPTEPAEPQLPGLGTEDTASVTPDGALVMTPTQVEPAPATPTPTEPELAPVEPAVTSSLTGVPVTETSPSQPEVDTPAPELVSEEPEPVPAPVTTPEPAPVAVTEPAPAVTAEPKVDVTAMATADLGVRLEALEKRLDQVSAAADKAPAAEQSAIQALDQDIRALKTDLGKISSRLTALENRPAPVAAAAPKAEPTPAPQVVIAPAPTVTDAPKVEVKKPATTATAKPAVPAPVWSLRAAQPGEAWVSEGQSKELRKVSVGDTLAGIGKIQQIRQVSGRWEIVGSQMTIRQ